MKQTKTERKNLMIKSKTPIETKEAGKPIVYTDFATPTYEEIEEQVRELMRHPVYESYYCEWFIRFSKPTMVRKNRKNTITEEYVKVRLFFSTKGDLAYTFYERSGFAVWDIEYTNIAAIGFIKDEKKIDKKQKQRRKQVEKLLEKRYDEHTWKTLTEKDIDYNYGTNIVYLKNFFDEQQLAELKEAFQKKEEKEWFSNSGVLTTRRMQTRLHSDGTFHAYLFSNPFQRKDSYEYKILNPDIATFGRKW